MLQGLICTSRVKLHSWIKWGRTKNGQITQTQAITVYESVYMYAIERFMCGAPACQDTGIAN